MAQRLVVVSNRCPINEKPGDAVARALTSELASHQGLWLGPSGNLVDGGAQQPRIVQRGRVTLAGVDIDAETYTNYYNGFCKQVLWPLMHFRLGPIEFHDHAYRQYRLVNQHVADMLTPLLRDDDIIWVHDYHHIPLVSQLRKSGVRNPIGFFLHCPFPPPEIFEVLPVVEDLLADLSSCTVIGFQTSEDERTFGATFARYQDRINARPFDQRVHQDCPQTFVCPTGIDAQATAKLAQKAMSAAAATRLLARFEHRHLILGIDDIDFTKGMPQRLLSMNAVFGEAGAKVQDADYLQLFLGRKTSGGGKLKRSDRRGQNARRFDALLPEPIRSRVTIMDKPLPAPAILALYRHASVGLATPLRDGMNLAAKEFIAAQDPRDPGILLLSRFAGAAQRLDGVILVNPYDVDEVARGIVAALSMPVGERRARWLTSSTEIQIHSAAWWARTITEKLVEAELAMNSRRLMVSDTLRAAQCLF